MAQPGKQGSGLTAIVTLLALACAGWGFVEHRGAQRLTDTLAAANGRIAQLQRDLDTMRGQLTATKRQLDESVKLKMPVEVAFRPAPSGSGLIAVFKNNSPEALPISVALINPLTSRRRESNFTIEANGLQSIGESQGWAFAPGQRVQVTNPQFGTAEYTVPELTSH
jgi:hypothetical protein